MRYRTVGRYAVFGEIAQGGMGTVHFGRLLGPAGFSRTVAIKRLRPELARDPEFVSSFVDEARLAARIRHPNVVATLDVEKTDEDLVVVMEYIAGESLAQLLRTAKAKEASIPHAIATSILSDTLRGLYAAHEASDERGEPLAIVHRDVSPQNILVGADGVARIADFGVAKAIGRAQTTRAGQLKGKLRYMAPEQVLLEPLTPRADLYAAAVVLWEILSAKPLVTGESSDEMIACILKGEFDPPSRHCPNVPPALDRIVMQGLERNPARRFETARAFSVALEEEVGLATTRQVEEWVRSIAGERLARFSEELLQIEIDSSQGLAPPGPERLAPEGPSQTAWSTATVPERRGPRRRPAPRWIAFFAACAAIAGYLGTQRSEDGPPLAVSRGPAGMGAPQPATLAAPAPTTTIGEAFTATASKEARGNRAALPEGTLRARASGAPVVHESIETKTPPRRRPAQRPARADCTPAYWVDAAGIRRLKPECL